MIHISGVSKTFGGAVVLDGVNLKLESGRTHIILGSSGSGKSTLLRILMGLLPADEGTVEVRVQSGTGPLASKIGYVVQEGVLFPHMTIRQNTALMAKIAGWSREKIETRLHELFGLTGLAPELARRFPRELSGGQRQRAGLMRALMLDPPILVMDEPLGALDPLVRSSLQKQLKEIFSVLNKTVVLVTHDINEAAFFGDTVTLMTEGRVVQHGTFSDLVHNPASPFVTDFLNAQKPAAELRVFL